MKRMIALLLSVILSVPFSSFAAPSSTVPEFVQAFTPPAALGFVESYYQGNSPHPVLLLQDLHANYGVQTKLARLLRHWQARLRQGGQPVVIGVEGAWQPLDVSFTKGHAPEVRADIDDRLLRQAEMTGPEHFAIMAEEPVQLIGIDDQKDYELHAALVRKSWEIRAPLAAKASALAEDVARSKRRGTWALKRLWKLENRLENGEMGLKELAARLGVPTIADYGQAASILYNRKLSAAAQAGDNAFFLTNLVKADQDLRLLARLLREHLTLEEVKFAVRQIPEILTVVRALQPKAKIAEWQEAIQTATDYYAAALMRDEPLARHAAALAEQHASGPVVIVTGGFHTRGISDYLKERKISHLVVTPRVDAHTTRDEALYLQRILGMHPGEREILRDLAAACPRLQVRALSSLTALTRPGDVLKHLYGAVARDPKPRKASLNPAPESGLHLPAVTGHRETTPRLEWIAMHLNFGHKHDHEFYTTHILAYPYSTKRGEDKASAIVNTFRRLEKKGDFSKVIPEASVVAFKKAEFKIARFPSYEWTHRKIEDNRLCIHLDEDLFLPGNEALLEGAILKALINIPHLDKILEMGARRVEVEHALPDFLKLAVHWGLADGLIAALPFTSLAWALEVVRNYVNYARNKGNNASLLAEGFFKGSSLLEFSGTCIYALAAPNGAIDFDANGLHLPVSNVHLPEFHADRTTEPAGSESQFTFTRRQNVFISFCQDGSPIVTETAFGRDLVASVERCLLIEGKTLADLPASIVFHVGDYRVDERTERRDDGTFHVYLDRGLTRLGVSFSGDPVHKEMALDMATLKWLINVTEDGDAFPGDASSLFARDLEVERKLPRFMLAVIHAACTGAWDLSPRETVRSLYGMAEEMGYKNMAKFLLPSASQGARNYGKPPFDTNNYGYPLQLNLLDFLKRYAVQWVEAFEKQTGQTLGDSLYLPELRGVGLPRSFGERARAGLEGLSRTVRDLVGDDPAELGRLRAAARRLQTAA